MKISLPMIQFSPSPSLTANPFQQIVAPIINLLNMVIGPALLVVGAVGAIWCILLGVKFAKAEEQQDRDKAKGALKNAIIGFVLIFVLLVVLRVAMPALANWAAVSLPS